MESNNLKRNKTIEELKAELDAATKAYEDAKEEEYKRALEEAKRKEEELAKQKEIRKAEIEEKEKELTSLYNEYLKDYGKIKFTRKSDDCNFFSPFWSNISWF